MRVLITGGTGYVGRALVDYLLQQTGVDRIDIYDNLSRGSNQFFLGPGFPHADKIHLVEGDILDTRKLQKYVDQADVIVHLAARVSTPFADMDAHYFEQTNHWGTAELVYAAERSGAGKLVYVSSTAVYGSSTEEKTEDAPTAPQTFYGVSKLRGEEHVRRLASTTQAIVLRLANVYGFNPCMRFDAVINRFMFDAHFKRRIRVTGSGAQYRAFIHVRNAGRILGETVMNSVPSGTYHAVDRSLRIIDVIDALKILYPDVEILFTDQHVEQRELRISPQSQLRQYLDWPETSNLDADLSEFRQHFSF
jgi:UDP-glucose 4-epimerase